MKYPILELKVISRSVIDSEKRNWVINSLKSKHYVDTQTGSSRAKLT